MKKLWVILAFFIHSFAKCSEWYVLLEQHHKIMDATTYEMLARQCQHYASNVAPTIAQPCIKEIPIQECKELAVDIQNMRNQRITIISDKEALSAHEFVTDIDPRSEGFSKMREGVYQALERMVAELDRLAPHFGYKPGSLHIKLWEGLRDLETQKKIFEAKWADIKRDNPKMTDEQAYQEATKWVSPYINNVPTHSTGAAIDIHLWDAATGTFCDMGRFNAPGAVAPTFTEEGSLTIDQKNNRLLMLIAATSAGLTNYVYEFWHFSYGDRYAAFWRNSEDCVAIYGAL